MCKVNDKTMSDSESTDVLQDTPVQDIPNIVTRVAEKAKEWKAVPVKEKIALLEGILQKSIDCRQEWVDAGMKARQIDASERQSHGWAMGEVEITGPVLFGSYCNGILKTLKAVAKKNKAPAPRKVRPMGKDGHVAVSVYPDRSLLEFTETVGMQGELILKPTNKDNHQLQTTYESYAVGGTAGILGAGNYDMPADILTELFIKGRCAIYKPNPVVQNSAPVLQKIFGALIERGFLAFIIGGAAVGSALVQHPALDEVVLTGSVNTFQKIQPLVEENNTPICAELGAVNPWIIVPGPKWNQRSVNAHARALAFAKLVNNGHVCAAPQVILVAKDWKWRNQFMKRLKYWLAQHPGSPSFYPGADKNHEYFAQMDGAEEVLSESLKAEQSEKSASFGKHSRQSTVVISDIDGSLPSAKEEGTEGLPPKSNLEVLTREAFCPVLAEVAVDVSEQDDAVVFLKAAVEYAETKLFGSLTACILMDDRTTRRKEVDQIIADMKFGAVGINIYPSFCYSLPQMIWGAFPGQTESGQGFLGNCCFFRGVEKAVLKAPFTWIGRKLLQVEPSAPKAHLVFQRMGTYKMNPTLMNQSKFFAALFLGV